MLRADTQALWDVLKDQKALGGFVLIGGTALSMHLNHRLSEDLDFAFDGPRLPRARIEALKRRLDTEGWPFTPNDPLTALQEFEDTGLDLHDYQQNHIVGSRVKLTLVAPEHEVRVQLRAAAPDHPRVASLEEIFRLKCIACANRSKTRDWLDLYLLLRDGHFQPIDMRAPFEAAGAVQKFDIAMRRLCSGKPEAGDEGYDSLLDEPPTIAQMRDYFLDIRDGIEREVARRARTGDPRA
jgi:hypothetical protein